MAVVADTRQTSANAQCRQSSCHTYTAIIYLSIIERSSIYLRFFACKSRHVAHAPADATRISQWLTNCKLLANLFDFFLSSSWSHRRWKTYVLTAEWSIDGVIHLIYYLRADFGFSHTIWLEIVNWQILASRNMANWTIMWHWTVKRLLTGNTWMPVFFRTQNHTRQHNSNVFTIDKLDKKISHFWKDQAV